MRTPQKIIQSLISDGDVAFAFGSDRYALYSKWGYVCVASLSDGLDFEELAEITTELSGGDCDAYTAKDTLNDMRSKKQLAIGAHLDPIVAMSLCIVDLERLVDD